MPARIRVALSLGAALLLIAALVGPASAADVMVVRLTGTAEVANGQAGAGDLDARGLAVLKRTALPGANDRLCWSITTRGMVLPAIAAHIHGPTANGGSLGLLQIAGPVVDFSSANNTDWPRELPRQVGASSVGQARGCAEVADATLNAIWADPDRYYVNVHNTPFPGGAVRGQLG